MKSRREFLQASAGTIFASYFLDEFLARAALADAGGGAGEVFEAIRRKYDIPALATCTIFKGHILEPLALGVRKYGGSVPVTVNDEFHLGSDTKAMTATLIGILVEEGKLQWTSTVGRLLPDLARTMHEGFKSVSIDMLLAHRGGWKRNTPSGKSLADIHHLPGSPRAQRWEYLKMMLAEAPDYEPGSQFNYSNAGYALLGVIAEQLTDTPWEMLMGQKIFGPLGMQTAGYGAMGTPGRVDQPWQHVVKEGKVIPVEPGPMRDNPIAIAPAGLVHCSIGDWAKFVRIHAAEGKTPGCLLKPETFQHLHTPLFGGDYVAGWAVANRPWAKGKALTHTGSNKMNTAVVWVAPELDFAVMVATNIAAEHARKACDEACGMSINHYLASGAAGQSAGSEPTPPPRPVQRTESIPPPRTESTPEPAGDGSRPKRTTDGY